ncbi:MAG: SpoIID/LytB domain-containing protein [Clostridiales bacterium]|nr:SpoIID/LytB domain-containing protein [Clostridiales bacterium]
MKRGTIIGKLLMGLELALLTGMVLLSFYLFYGYLKQGEQEVNGTANLEGSVDSETNEDSGMSIETDEDSAALPNTDKDAAATGLVQASVDEAAMIRVRILDSEYLEELFDAITISGTEGVTVEKGTYSEDYTFVGLTEENIAFTNIVDENAESRGKDDTADAESEMTAENGITAENEIADGNKNETEREEKTGDYYTGIYTVTASELQAGEALHLLPGEGGTLCVTNISRSYGSPEYSGSLYIYRLEGGLALVNELNLEEYLYAVVSSEMPSYYPLEAQKAQAVCARTYVVNCMGKNETGQLLADLDDSVSFQVYNNQQSTENSREAVDATCGEILAIEEIQYYSTSCLSEHRDDLDTEDAFRDFLSEMPKEEAEYGSPWLRWQTELSSDVILEKLREVVGMDAKVLTGISVEARNGNGQAQILRIAADDETLELEGEYEIRRFLAPEETEVELMDGTTVVGMQLLPSAFFYIDIEHSASDDTETIPVGAETDDGMQENSEFIYALRICGGGYGHGNGMSQYGAAQMASEGASYLEILEYYYTESQ